MKRRPATAISSAMAVAVAAVGGAHAFLASPPALSVGRAGHHPATDRARGKMTMMSSAASPSPGRPFFLLRTFVSFLVWQRSPARAVIFFERRVSLDESYIDGTVTVARYPAHGVKSSASCPISCKIWTRVAFASGLRLALCRNPSQSRSEALSAAFLPCTRSNTIEMHAPLQQ